MSRCLLLGRRRDLHSHNSKSLRERCFRYPKRNWTNFASGKLRRTNLFGGSAATICDAPNGRGGSWNREDVIIFAPSPRSPLFRVSSKGGEPKPVTGLDKRQGEVSHRWPSFLPDGRHFSFVAQNSRWERSNIYVAAVDAPGEIRNAQMLRAHAMQR